MAITQPIKLFITAAVLVIMTGCSTLDVAISDEFKFGRIYAMKTALVEAVDSCEDQRKVELALYWARKGMMDLPEYLRYMGNVPGVTEQGRALDSALQGLMQVKDDQVKVCEQMRQASLVSQQFTVALSGRASVMVAMND